MEPTGLVQPKVPFTYQDFQEGNRKLGDMQMGNALTTHPSVGLWGKIKSWFTSAPTQQAPAPVPVPPTEEMSSSTVEKPAGGMSKETPQPVQPLQFAQQSPLAKANTMSQAITSTNLGDTLQNYFTSLAQPIGDALQGAQDNRNATTNKRLAGQKASANEPVQGSGGGFAAALLTQIPGVAFDQKSKYVTFRPKTLDEKIGYYTGTTLGFFAGAGMLKKAFSLFGSIGAKLFGSTAFEFLQKGATAKAIQSFETTFPKITSLIAGSEGLGKYIDETIKLAGTLNAVSQLTKPLNTPLRTRLEDIVKTSLIALPFARMGLIDNPYLRISSHGAYFFTQSMLSNGDIEGATINGTIGAVLGAMPGGITGALNNDAIYKQASENLSSLPELKGDMRLIDHAINLGGQTQEKAPEHVLTPVVESVKKIDATVGKEINRNLQTLDPESLYKKLVTENTVDLNQMLSDAGVGSLTELEKKFQNEVNAQPQTEMVETAFAGKFKGQDIYKTRPIESPTAAESEKAFAAQGKSGEDISSETRRRLAQLLEISFSPNVDLTGFQKDQRPTIEQKQMAKLVTSFGDMSPEQRTALRNLIDKSDNAETLLKVIERTVNAHTDKLLTLSNQENFKALAEKKFVPNFDQERFQKIFDNFKQTDGSRTSLAQSVLDAYGKKGEGSTPVQTANRLVKEFGFDSIDHLNNWMRVNAPDTFNGVNKLEISRDVVKQKLRDTVNFDFDLGKPIDMSTSDTELIKKVKGKSTPEFDSNAIITESSNLGDSPEQMASIEQKSGEGSDLKPATDIALKLVEFLDPNFIKGRLPRGVKGAATGDQQVKMRDFSTGTFLHETAGHIIDARYNITQSIKENLSNGSFKALETELKDNLDPARKEKYDPSKHLSESFAEMMRQYMTGQNVEDKFPLTLDYTRSILKTQEPNLLDLLEQTREDYIARDESDPMANLVTDVYNQNEGQIISQFTESLKDKTFVPKMKEALTNLYRDQLNVAQYVKPLDEAAGNTQLTKQIYNLVTTGSQRISGFFEDQINKGIYKDQDHVLNWKTEEPVRATRGLTEIWNDVPQAIRKQFGGYLLATQAEVRAKSAATEGRKMIFPENLTPDKILAVKSYMESKFPQARQIAEEIKGFNSALRQVYLDRGWISQEAFNKMNESEYFASFVRQGGVFDNDFEWNKKSSSVQKKFFGSERPDLVDPFLSATGEVYSMSKRLVTDHIYKQIYDVASQHGDKIGKLAIVENTPPIKPFKPTPEEVMKTLELYHEFKPAQREEMLLTLKANEDLLPEFWRPYDGGEEGLVKVRVNGENKFMRLDPKVRDSFDALNKNASANWLQKGLQKFTNFKKSLATTFSPSFILKNPIRDSFDAYFQADSGFIPVMDSFKGLQHFIQKDNVWTIGNRYGLNNERIMGESSDVMRENLVKFNEKEGMGSYVTKFKNAMTNLSKGSEMMSRLGVLGKYDLSNSEQMLKGILDAQQSTMNWSQRGLSDSAISSANKYVAFFKSRLVAFDKTLETFGKARTFKRAIPIVLLSLAQAYQQKDNKDFQEMPVFRRLMSINIPVGKSGAFVPIPIVGNPYFMLFWSLPQMIFSQFQKQDPELAKQFVSQMVQQTIPAAPNQFDDPGQLITSVLPDPLQPFMESWANKSSFTGNVLIPKSLQGLIPTEQYTAYTSDIAKKTADLFAASHLPTLGIFDNPIKVDNFLRETLFSAYTVAAGVTDYTAQKLGISANDLHKQLKVTNLPVINTFIHDAYEPSSAFEVGKALDKYTSYQEYYNTFNSLSKVDPKKAMTFLKDNKVQIIGYDRAAAFYSAFKDKMALYRAVQKKEGMNDDERTRQLDKIKSDILQMSQTTNEVLNLYENK